MVERYLAMNTLTEFFFMRDNFETFRLEPEKHGYLLFGRKDREQRNHLLNHLEEASYSLEGYKSVVVGDYGRGKTHQSRNLESEIKRMKLAVHPVYLKCPEFKSKEPFNTFFRELLLGLSADKLSMLATEYERLTQAKQKPPLQEVLNDEFIGLVMRKGLTAPNRDVVVTSMRWLGGETKIDMGQVSSSLPPLTSSKQFGSVMRGIVQLFREIDKTVPLYIVDEAERFALVSNTDSYWSWMASMRELTEIPGVAFLFFVGAKSRDDLPAMFSTDEIVTRVGVSNYVEFYNQSKEDLEDFLKELLHTLIRKGPLADPFRSTLQDKLSEGIDAPVPSELLEILKDQSATLETYPFTVEAFNKFVDDSLMADLSNKPREVLIRVQKAVGRAMRYGQRLIDSKILDEITKDGI
jgi:Cdc6-like AAA superfamily ATPase